MKRLRIGVDFHTYDGIYQGSRSHILGLFKQAIILAPEFDFVFFLSSVEKLQSEHPEFNRPNVTLVKMASRPSIWRLALQLPFLRLRHRIDLLHTQYRIPFLPTGPSACTIHDVLFETHPQYFSKFFVLQSKLSFRIAAKFSKILFTVSEFSKSELVRHYSVSSAKLGVTYNGVDFTRFYPGDGGSSRLQEVGLVSGEYILTVGRLEPRKNHIRLIEAYAKLDPTVPPLICVGQRDFDYEAILALVDKLGIQNRVRFLENVDDALLPILMRHSKIFVFPAIAEGFGMPVAEALASGAPVLTSNSTSLPEVSGAAAVLVNPLDVPEIAKGMALLLSDSSLRLELRERGLEQVKQFDWAKSASFLVESYAAFFDKKRR